MANGDDFMKTLYLAHDHLKNIRFIFKFWICTYNTHEQFPQHENNVQRMTYSDHKGYGSHVDQNTEKADHKPCENSSNPPVSPTRR